MKCLALACCVLLFVKFASGADYFPPIKFLKYFQAGFRISVPHQNDMQQVDFHLLRIVGEEKHGPYNITAKEPLHGNWIAELTDEYIELEDTLHYKIIIKHMFNTSQKEERVKISAWCFNIHEPEELNSADRSLPSGCVRSATTVKGRPVCQGRLIFEDNFNTLNWTMWSREVRIPLDEDDEEFVSYQSRPENFYINNGKLHIVPTLLQDLPDFNESSIYSGTLDLGESCTGIVESERECFKKAMFAQILPPVVSARARTKDFFSFRYGKVEVRAKVPKGDWIFPLILLEPLENFYGSKGYASGQMRVAFVRGNEYLKGRYGEELSGRQVSGGAVVFRSQDLREMWLRSTLRDQHFGNDFHVYTLTWTDKNITLQVDGETYFTVEGGIAGYWTIIDLRSQTKRWLHGLCMAPFDREFYLTLGVAVGGHGDFADNILNGVDLKMKPWQNNNPKAAAKFWRDRENWLPTWQGDNANLQVDYIRVYAL